ncbi:MAG TPA: FAD-dependent oxidoreductase, partial [Bryobacteraceae bacterium]|nr:FAD-dependent oxidoreductase [Bryobacteraceae bacterium]
MHNVSPSSLRPSNDRESFGRIRRRDALKLAALLVDPTAEWAAQPATRKKRVIVAGGGLAGLVCAYELHRRDHDVVVLEASNR